MKTLMLPVRRKWFELIKSGNKTSEYRRMTPYWSARLDSKQFDKVAVTLGYPPKEDSSRRLEFPWNGITTKIVACEEFGAEPLRVFAIRLVDEARQFWTKDENALECVYCGAEVRRRSWEDPETSAFLTRAGGWMRRHKEACLGGVGGSEPAARRLPTELLSLEKNIAKLKNPIRISGERTQ